MSRLFLGVDGGQSSTTALIGDETGRVLGSGRGGPCNHVGAAEGRAKFTGAITGSLTAACAEAGLDPATVRFEAACLGFSGGPDDKQSILHEILRAERLIVSNDALIALSGATAGEPGIITIAGTGSIAYGRNAAGEFRRAGGDFTGKRLVIETPPGYLDDVQPGDSFLFNRASTQPVCPDAGDFRARQRREQAGDDIDAVVGQRQRGAAADRVPRCPGTGYPRFRMQGFRK